MTYTFYSIKHGFSKNCALDAYWEVALDPISDHFTPNDISAEALFQLWVEEVQRKYTDGLIPIRWFIRGKGITEFFPYQFCSSEKNFLDYWTHPVDTNGKLLNFLKLQVRDKLWNKQRCNKGGFIQQAIGWKPSVLQHAIYLPILLHTHFTHGVRDI